jgi:hypothetical protein
MERFARALPAIKAGTTELCVRKLRRRLRVLMIGMGTPTIQRIKLRPMILLL